MTTTVSIKEYAKAVEDRICKAALEAAEFHPDNFEAAGVMLVVLGMTPELEFLAGEALRKRAMQFLAEARGGGQLNVDTRDANAPATPSAGVDDKDRLVDDTLDISVPSAPVTDLSGFAQPLAGADDKGQDIDDTHLPFAPSAPAPRPRQPKHHAAASEVLTKSLLDEFKVTLRQGSRVTYGGVRLASLPRMYKQYGKGIWVKEREREVLRQTIELAKKQSYLPEDAEVRDLLDDKTLDMFIKKAMVVANGKASINYNPESSHA